MPFDNFIGLTTILEQRRKSIQQSLRSISVEELNEIAKRHQEEFVDDPWRVAFVRLVAEHPHGSFYYALPQSGLEVLYFREQDFGIWVLRGSGMGPLDDQAKRHMKEAITAARQPA